MTKIQKVLLTHYRNLYRERCEKFKNELRNSVLVKEIGSPPAKEIMGMAFKKLGDHRNNFKIFLGVIEKRLESRKPMEDKDAG